MILALFPSIKQTGRKLPWLDKFVLITVLHCGANNAFKSEYCQDRPLGLIFAFNLLLRMNNGQQYWVKMILCTKSVHDRPNTKHYFNNAIRMHSEKKENSC